MYRFLVFYTYSSETFQTPEKKRNKFNEVNKSQEVKIIRILCKYRVIPIIGESDRMALSHYNWGSELLYN